MSNLKIIDVHCGWGATTAAPQWNDMAQIRSAMQSRGIGIAFASSVLARRYDLTTGNDALFSAISDTPGEDETDIRGWLTVHPARTVESIAQMRKTLYSERFVGVAIYTDPLTDAPVTIRDAHDLATAFRRFAKPLLVEAHTAQAMSQVVDICEDLAGVKVIASGMGGDEWREAIGIASRAANLFLDISGALVPEKIELALAVLGGPRKLLFASGAPQTDPAAMLGLLEDVVLSSDARERILYTNAARLFNLLPATRESVALRDMNEPTPTANYLVGNADNPAPN